MKKSERTVGYSAEAVRRKIARGESKTDWRRVKAMSQAKVNRLADVE